MSHIVQTDFDYTEEQLAKLTEFLDSHGISYEVFEDEEGLYKAAMADISPNDQLLVATWELDYFDSL